MRANLQRYGAANVEPVPLALSDRRGRAQFHVSSGRPAHEFAGKEWNYGNKSSSLLPPASVAPMHGWIEFKETIDVPTDTLENFARERQLNRIDFIHLDVQGAERLVLRGAAGVLPQVRAIWLEVSEEPLYLGQAIRGEIELFMRSRGFTLAYSLRRAIEGDQLYLNRRRPDCWPYLAGNRLRRTARWLGAIRRSIGQAAFPR